MGVGSGICKSKDDKGQDIGHSIAMTDNNNHMV